MRLSNDLIESIRTEIEAKFSEHSNIETLLKIPKTTQPSVLLESFFNLLVVLQASCIQLLTPNNRKNQMVAELGKYDFFDWAKLGLLLQVLNGLITIPLVYYLYPYTWSIFKLDPSTSSS